MKMTFPQYIANPMGNRVMSNTKMYETMYAQKLDKLLVRENGQTKYYLFKDSPSRYIALIKVPSESVKGFFYDVVIEFWTKNDKEIAKESLEGYYVRFFANDPAFMYNFAYSFIQNDLFFEDLEIRMSKQARENKASITNKKNEVGYVKTIFFAYLIMRLRKLFNKSIWDYEARKYNKAAILAMVQHSSVKEANRRQAAIDAKRQAKSFEKLEKVNPLAGLKSAKTGAVAPTTSTRIAKKVKHVNSVKKI